ncbi:MAG TPA: tRNA (adenosine(37)-N6)-threonylcarbamoyltransferase complex dimerization subunit type 1 TsaB [Mycobacteriales bacterium]|nr:tRNA (adenosine(37)-N6)-threonylcarbamoyltransferase complex dimerization subunit type 1 TsaB [Mycobacteriales bacterium]
MLVLLVDTSSAAVTAGVGEVRDGHCRVLAHRSVLDGKKHGEALAPLVTACLTSAGAVPADLGAVVADVGPGPFTGLRVGLVTAAAFADALGIPAYGVCSLDALAAAVADDGPPFLVATDARRREVYWALYGGTGERLTEPAVSKPALVAGLAAERGARRAVGAGARLYADVLGLPLSGPDHPDVESLLSLAASRVTAAAPPEPLTPLYLRRPDAVEPAARKSVLG